MLSNLHLGDGHNVGTADGRIALDCSVRKLQHKAGSSGGSSSSSVDLYSVSTTDFFFPLVDSPYVQGLIGAANVLSDLYAQGVETCDFVLMLLAACRDMPEDDRTICTQEMVRGFRDNCLQAETVITGGQTVLNPWPIIGGVATSVVTGSELVFSDGAQVGNVVVLTKPLGTQIAVNVHQWKRQYQQYQNENGDNTKTEKTTPNRHWKAIVDKGILTFDEASTLMHRAVCSMARLNKHGARLMIPHGATAATDVTGFGLLGHAQNLVENQVAAVGMELHTLPCLKGSMAVNRDIMNFRLEQGYSAETSGGLLVVLPNEAAAMAYCQELQQLDGDDCPSWIVGRIVADPQRKAVLKEPVQILHV